MQRLEKPLILGDTGPLVSQLQQGLKDRGYTITVDGAFGPATEQVVRTFQTETMNVPDGVVFNITWGKLFGAMEVLITGPMLRKVCTSLSEARAAILAQLMCEECPQFGITDRNALQEFVARCAVESYEFKSKAENLNYSAARLLEVWPTRFTAKTAYQYQYKPEALAAKVYDGRKELGNKFPGDGWTFRGAAFIQSTGRTMAEAFGEMIGASADRATELARTDDRVAMKCSAWIFGVVKKLVDEARRDDIITVVRKINGGLTGLRETQAYHKLALRWIK